MTDDAVAYLERIMALPRAELVGKELCKTLHSFGFDGLVYAYQRVMAGRSMRLQGRTHVFVHHSPRFLAELFGGGHFGHSWGLDWARVNEGVISWGQMADWSSVSSTDESREVWRRHGLRAGYLIAFRGPGMRTYGLMSLSAQDRRQAEADAIWARHGRLIHAICQITHLRVSTLPPPDLRLLEDSPLSPRQREVLEWAAAGKTAADIATILGVTPATVEKHLRLARLALGCETTTQAVMTATIRDQIFDLPVDLTEPSGRRPGIVGAD